MTSTWLKNVKNKKKPTFRKNSEKIILHYAKVELFHVLFTL